MVVVTYLPLFVTRLFRGMPGIWKSRHRLILCWLVFMQALYPGRKTLEELSRWTPAAITAWRFRRLLQASYWNVHLDRKSTRLNSSHITISYAVFCLKKKKKNN